MESKITELAKSIYREGVEKAETEARRIISGAEDEAKRLVDNARTEADAILADARKKADEIRANTDSEVRLSGNQAISLVKQRILDLLITNAIDSPVKSLLVDTSLLKEIILLSVKNWSPSSAKQDLQVLLPESKRKQLESALESTIKDLIGQGIEVRFVDGFQAGLQIGLKSGGYKVSMTDKDSSEFFKSFLRPVTKEFLFGK